MTETQTPSAFSFDVGDADFETAVVARSREVPVLLDCWAPWCGPCRVLKPMLEKLAAAYEGRFVLAKLNSDENPQVAALLGLRSIPHVVLFKDGRPVDQFSGALPEGQLRAFLDAHLQPPSEAERLRRQAAKAPPAEAETLLRQALALEPDDPELITDLAEQLAARRPDEARALLAGIPEVLREPRQQALQARLDFAALQPAGDEAALRERVAADAKDFDARFDLAALLAHRGDFAAAFDELLEIVLRDRSEGRAQRERARARMVEWFTLCTDAAVVEPARRRLAMYLN
jgi:putative thioredoxin